MSVRWDPKIRSNAPKAASPAVPPAPVAGQAPPATEPPAKPTPLREPTRAETRPSPPAPAAPASPWEQELERLRQTLRLDAQGRAQAAKHVLALALSYPLRRSRGALHKAISLCEEVATEAPELATPAHELALWLGAEGDLLETSGEATLKACRTFTALIEATGDLKLGALARSGLAHALIQLATHFPGELGAVDLDAEAALAQALALAEEAVAQAPELPDGHVALGRLLLCHDDPQAWADAREVLEHALALDGEHDPAETALAVALHALGRVSEAREHVERVIHRGSGQAQPLLLRALMALAAGKSEEARRDLARAAHIAPRAGLVHLDAARAAEAAGDHEAAQTHHARARELLGAASAAVLRALTRT